MESWLATAITDSAERPDLSIVTVSFSPSLYLALSMIVKERSVDRMLTGKYILGVKQKNPHAVALGRKGGKARAHKLSPDQRRRIAQKAARARWGKPKEQKPTSSL